MAISKSQKRYNVCLTPSVVDRYYALAEKVGVPGNMSSLFEDALKQTSTLLEVVIETGALTSDDLRKILGTQMDQIQEDERKEDVNEKRKETQAA